MHVDLQTPWFIVGAYLAAYLWLMIGSKAEDRAASPTSGAWRVVSLTCYSLAGTFFSVATFAWLNAFLHWAVPTVLGTCAAIAVSLLVWRQKRTIPQMVRRLGAVHHTPGGWERPGFGVLPNGRAIVAAGDRRAGFEHALEFSHRGRQVLGVDYIATKGPRDRSRGTFVKFSHLINHHHMVQLRTPSGPTVHIAPRTNTERRGEFGPVDPNAMDPLLEMRLSRSMTGAVELREGLTAVDSDDLLLDQRFTFHVADPASLRALLTPGIRELLQDDPWFRLGPVTLQLDTVWTTRSGRLTEAALLEGSRRLARFVDLIPLRHWRSHGDASGVDSPDHGSRPDA